jgi:hypothetical protein
VHRTCLTAQSGRGCARVRSPAPASRAPLHTHATRTKATAVAATRGVGPWPCHGRGTNTRIALMQQVRHGADPFHDCGPLCQATAKPGRKHSPCADVLMCAASLDGQVHAGAERREPRCQVQVEPRARHVTAQRGGRRAAVCELWLVDLCLVDRHRPLRGTLLRRAGVAFE